MTDLLDVAFMVTGALEVCGIRYSVGGSLASSVSGEPRASIDADVLVEMTTTQIAQFLDAVGPDFYADPEAIDRAIQARSSTNLIHRPTGIKVDLFVAGSWLDAQQLDRRQRVQLRSDPAASLYLHSPEDILLQKLHWFRLGGEVSERQWRDVVAILSYRVDASIASISRDGRHSRAS